MAQAAAPAGAPAAEAVMARAGGENFPVALGLLAGRDRRALLAIYGFARLVDELGDSYEGDRTEALDWLATELDRAYAGRAGHPLLSALTPVIRERALPRQPFLRLIEANRLDQRASRYESWQQLREYCRLSADPVGELVLAVFGVRDAGRIALSDRICTALQLTEHLQDIAEDHAHGRVYLPAEDMRRFGVRESELAAGPAGTGLRELIAFEVARARALLEEGEALIGQLPARPALAVAAFAAGGRAALSAIERARGEVLAGPPRAGRLLLARELGALCARAALRPLRARAQPGRQAAVSAQAGSLDDVALAYAQCEAITRVRAANFYWGIRLLAAERRRALCAAYALARRIDDVGDGSLGRERKLELLGAEEQSLRELQDHRSGPAADPVLLALGDAHRRFPLPLVAFSELIEGVRADVLGVRYESFEELVLYCRRVAGGIGRICLAAFALRGGAQRDARAQQLADDLGVALQLTNILRDVREDSLSGRVYLPAEDLRRFGIEDLPAAVRAGAGPGGAAQAAALAELIAFEADRAQQWFARGLQLVALLDRRSAACVLAMAGIYRRLLERIQADPAQVLVRRVSLSSAEKGWVAARGLLGRRP